jgi:hypothetical protein
LGVLVLLAKPALGGPELAMREFASGQIKKGVRAIGMGGDGATVGNYSLVWKDADTALADYGITSFTDTGNTLQFVAVGYNTPSFWNGTSLFVIAMSEWGSSLRLHLRSPAYAEGADFGAEASDQAVFMKVAKPLRHGIAVGLLLSWERSSAVAISQTDGGTITYTTSYLPSGGAGVTWTANRWLLVGARALLNNDEEHVRDAVSTRTGWNRAWELRAGASVYLWPGGTLDAGYVGLIRGNAIDGTSYYQSELVAGVEERFFHDQLWVRAGWDESSPSLGVSARLARFKLDLAYVHDLGIDRSKGTFGQTDNAVLATLNFDYSMRRP